MKIKILKSSLILENHRKNILAQKNTEPALVFLSKIMLYIFCDYNVRLRHSQRTHTHPYERIARKPYSYEYLQKLDRQVLEIDEASLSTGTSHSTESTNTVKS